MATAGSVSYDLGANPAGFVNGISQCVHSIDKLTTGLNRVAQSDPLGKLGRQAGGGSSAFTKGMQSMMSGIGQTLSFTLSNYITRGIDMGMRQGMQALKLGMDDEMTQVSFKNLLGGSDEAATDFMEKIRVKAAKTPFNEEGLMKFNRAMLMTGRPKLRSARCLRPVSWVVLHPFGKADPASGLCRPR